MLGSAFDATVEETYATVESIGWHKSSLFNCKGGENLNLSSGEVLVGRVSPSGKSELIDRRN